MSNDMPAWKAGGIAVFCKGDTEGVQEDLAISTSRSARQGSAYDLSFCLRTQFGGAWLGLLVQVVDNFAGSGIKRISLVNPIKVRKAFRTSSRRVPDQSGRKGPASTVLDERRSIR